MAERFMDEDVKTRLILSGIAEIESGGVKDFSLRRAAELAGVSCAAPYRYFKSKEDYITNIYSYLAEKWNLLLLEIERAYSFDKRAFLLEALTANIRFWLANKNLRTALMMADGGEGKLSLSDFDKVLFEKIEAYLNEYGVEEKEIRLRLTSLRAALYGFITLIGAEAKEATSEFSNVKSTFEYFI